MKILSQAHFEDHKNEADSKQGIPARQLPDLDVVGVVRRQGLLLLGAAGIGAVLGLGFIMQAVPSYSSSASILIDPKNVGMAATTALESSLAFESGVVDSQLQIMQSDKLATMVSQRLGLQDNYAFLSPPPSALGGLVQRVQSALGSGVRLLTGAPEPIPLMDLPENYRLLIATMKLQSNLDVSRIGRTYVFSLGYTDDDPSLAQTITGQYVNAYLEDQLDSKFDSTRRATHWMEDRIRELRSRSLAADQSVQRYRADNNLVEASGRLIDDQTLIDATTQLAAARTNLDSASARYQRLKEIVDKQDVTASLTESSGNLNASQLRGKYLEAAKLYSDMMSRYGENHSVAIKAKKDMAEYQRLVFEELKNLLPGYQSDVSIAQTRVNSIQQTVSELRTRSISNDSAMVKLRSLEQEADSLKQLYSTFLQKSQEMQQQQSFPVTDARIISEPSMATAPSGPNRLLIVAGFMFAGVALGAGVGGMREWRDRGIRTSAQVRDELGLEFLANIPILISARSLTKSKATHSNFESAQKAGAKVPMRRDIGLLSEVVDQPSSQFSEAIRALKIKIDLRLVGNKSIVIGIASMFPDEGKSTIAKNLASSLAYQGTKTILIDGDFRNPSLTRSLIGRPSSGLIDVAAGRMDLDEVVAIEERSGLAFLPGATRAQQGNDLFSNPSTQQFVSDLRQRFSVIVIDFPPVAALTDAIAASNHVDGYVFVANWGRTPRRSVKEFFENNPRIFNKTIGLALNKVDMKQLERYGSALGVAQYGKYAEKYFS